MNWQFLTEFSSSFYHPFNTKMIFKRKRWLRRTASGTAFFHHKRPFTMYSEKKIPHEWILQNIYKQNSKSLKRFSQIKKKAVFWLPCSPILGKFYVSFENTLKKKFDAFRVSVSREAHGLQIMKKYLPTRIMHHAISENFLTDANIPRDFTVRQYSIDLFFYGG